MEDEMAALREAGADVLVSMLTPSEATELGLAQEARAARAAGLQFVALPTPDRGVPEIAPLRALVRLLADELESSKHVVVHCRMGIGRSSMVAAAVLMARGLPEDDAWAAVGRARGLEVPDTTEQRSWALAAVADSSP